MTSSSWVRGQGERSQGGAGLPPAVEPLEQRQGWSSPGLAMSGVLVTTYAKAIAFVEILTEMISDINVNNNHLRLLPLKIILDLRRATRLIALTVTLNSRQTVCLWSQGTCGSW